LGNGLTETSSFNNRLQPCRVNVNSTAAYFSNCTSATPSGNVLDFTMGYNAGTNNGNVASWSAAGNQTFTRSYTYDSLNRISTMADSASGQACKGLSWTIDAWGNMTAQTQTSGTCYTFSSTAGTHNQLSGYTYDAAGNVTYDGTHHYTYDAENRIVQVDSGSTASYVYNENGKRARKNVGSPFTEFSYGPNGSVQSEYNAAYFSNCSSATPSGNVLDFIRSNVLHPKVISENDVPCQPILLVELSPRPFCCSASASARGQLAVFITCPSHPTAQFRNWIPHCAFQDRMHCTSRSRLIAFLKFFFSMHLFARSPTVPLLRRKKTTETEAQQKRFAGFCFTHAPVA
jgi:hypothetical protein